MFVAKTKIPIDETPARHIEEHDEQTREVCGCESVHSVLTVRDKKTIDTRQEPTNMYDSCANWRNSLNVQKL